MPKAAKEKAESELNSVKNGPIADSQIIVNKSCESEDSQQNIKYDNFLQVNQNYPVFHCLYYLLAR
jgi:hypothetical protein